MVILGIILALIGWIASISILLWVGVILVIVGLVLNFVRSVDRRGAGTNRPTTFAGPVWHSSPDPRYVALPRRSRPRGGWCAVRAPVRSLTRDRTPV